MTRWYRFRCWLHRLRYRMEFLPFDDQNIVAVCDCGGHARIARNPDGSATISDVRCKYWTWADLARRLPLPTARLLP